MSETPPDDIDDLYRRAAARDPSRPNESTRRSILEHAASLAAEHAARAHPIDIETARPARQRAWWPAVVGTLAAALLAGLVVIPRLWTPSATAPATARAVTSAAPTAPLSEYAPAPVPPSATAPARPPPSASADAGPSADAAPSVDAGRSDQQARQASAFVARQAAGLSRNHQAVDASAALRRAAQTGDIPALNQAFGQPVDVDARDADGRTALMLAILNRQGGAVDALLAHGADPNAADAAGTTPLAAALAHADPSIVSSLRRAGAQADQ